MKTIEILDENGTVINTILAGEEYAEAAYPGHWRVVEMPEPPAPPELTQFDQVRIRYQKRAAVKDDLIAYMAADNMGRVRSGVWSAADLTGLLDDPAVVAANTLMGTLSFELAAAQINAATTPLLTPEIKADWVSRLEAHYYLEG